MEKLYKFAQMTPYLLYCKNNCRSITVLQNPPESSKIFQNLPDKLDPNFKPCLLEK